MKRYTIQIPKETYFSNINQTIYNLGQTLIGAKKGHNVIFKRIKESEQSGTCISNRNIKSKVIEIKPGGTN